MNVKPNDNESQIASNEQSGAKKTWRTPELKEIPLTNTLSGTLVQTGEDTFNFS